MHKDFWLERWARKEIGFHQDEINPYLQRYWEELHLTHDATVFVPLCGKSRDMRWLREQGHSVIGVELSATAVEGFFAENGYIPERSSSGRFARYKADDILVLCGDCFDLRKDDLAGVSAVYDRASLIALPREMRERYVRHLVSILPPATRILLVALEYPQMEMPGPPFSVSASEVESLYGKFAKVRLLAEHDVLAQNPRFQERGLSGLRENIFLLTLFQPGREPGGSMTGRN